MEAMDDCIGERGRNPTRSIWVGNIPHNCLGQQIKDLFHRCGSIQSLSPDIHSRAVTRYAYVNFHEIESARRAVREYHNKPLFAPGENVLVRYTDPPRERKAQSSTELDFRAAKARDEFFTMKDTAKDGFRSTPPTGPRAWQPISPPAVRRSSLHRYDHRPAINSYRPSPRGEYRRNGREQESPPPDEYARYHDIYRPKEHNMKREGRCSPELGSSMMKTTSRISSLPINTENSTRAETQEPLPLTTYNTHAGEIAQGDQIAASQAEQGGLSKEATTSTTELSTGVGSLPAPSSGATQRSRTFSNAATVNTFTSALATFNQPRDAKIAGFAESSKLQELPNAKQPANDVLAEHLQSSSRAEPTQRSYSSGPLGPLPLTSASSMILKARGISIDDCSSITSSSTRTTSTTSQCADCKGAETEIQPLTLCISCSRRYHSSCGLSRLASVPDASLFTCGRCLRKGKSVTLAPSSNEIVQQALAAVTQDQISTDAALVDTPLQAEVRVEQRAQSRVVEHTAVKSQPACQRPSSLDVVGPMPQFRPNVDGRLEYLIPAVPNSTPSSLSKDVASDHNDFNNIEVEAEKATQIFESFKHRTSKRTEEIYSISAKEAIKRDAAETARRYKGVTCPHWQRRDCASNEADCIFAHSWTGVAAPSKGNLAKEFTCFRWNEDEDCRYGDQCRYAHRDTGLYVNSKDQASTKHITCAFWWCNGHCRHSAQECLYAHQDTGIYVTYRKRAWLVDGPGRKDTYVGRGHIESSYLAEKQSRSAAERSARPPAADFQVDRPFSAKTSQHMRPVCQEQPAASKSIDQGELQQSVSSQGPPSPDMPSIDKSKLHRSFGLQLSSSPVQAYESLPTLHSAATTRTPTRNSPLKDGSTQLLHGVDTPYSPRPYDDNYSPQCESPMSGIVSAVGQGERSESVLGSVSMIKDSTPSTLATRDTSISIQPISLRGGGLLGDGKSVSPPTPDVKDQGPPSIPGETMAKDPVRHFARRTGTADPRKRRRELAASSNTVNTNVATVEPQPIVRAPISPLAIAVPDQTGDPKPAVKGVKVCKGRGCRAKIYGATDRCKKCQEHLEQMPTPAESPAATEAVGALGSKAELTDETAPRSTRHDSPSSIISSSFLADLFKATANASIAAGRNVQTARVPKQISPAKRQASHEEVFIGKKPRLNPAAKSDASGLLTGTLAPGQLTGNLHNLPKAQLSLAELTERERRRKATEKIEQTSQQVRTTAESQLAGSDKENRRPSMSSMSYDMEVFQTENMLTERHRTVYESQGAVEPPLEGRDTASIRRSDREARDRSPIPSTQPTAQHAQVANARMEPQPGISSSVRERSPATQKAGGRNPCKKCASTHKRCFHNSDGTFDDVLCREYLEANAGKTYRELYISQRLHNQIMKAAGRAECGDHKRELENGLEDDLSEDFSVPDERSEEDDSSAEDPSDSSGDLGEADFLVHKMRFLDDQHDTDNRPRVGLRRAKISASRNHVDDDEMDDVPLAQRRLSDKSAQKVQNESDSIVAVMPTPEATTAGPSDDKPFDEAAHLARLRETGVQFEEDTDEDMLEVSDEAEAVRSPIRLPRHRVVVSRNLFEVAPSLRPDLAPLPLPKFTMPGESKPAKKNAWKNLTAYQCRERRRKFGNPHQEVERARSERLVKATIQETAPQSHNVSGRPNKFDVLPVQMRTTEIAFREFVGMPHKPMVVRDGPQGDLAFVEGENLRDREYGARGGQLRRATTEKYPFIKT